MRHALAAIWPTAAVLALAAAPALAPAWGQAAKLDATQQMGQHLFNQSCRVCHAKPQLNSVQYGPVLSKASASGNPKAMHDVIANGTPRMPGFKHHFKPEQIDAIVAYLQTVPPSAASPPAPAR
jgi:mono/diheme cytochrome c family protein